MVLTFAVAVVATGCRGSSETGHTRPSPTVASVPATTALTHGGVGRAGCRPATPFDARDNEIRGTTDRGQLWGLAFKTPFSDGPIRAGQRMKIVWRMTGHGSLKVTVTDPSGRAAPLMWGPEAHGGSTFQRPGDEWGTGFRFDKPGCWAIALRRADTRGAVWLRVQA